MSNRKGLLALSPLFVFVTIYLVASIIAQDFYKVPISVAFVIASIYAVAISYKNGLRQSVDIFSKGASKSNIMLMLWIFILAGAFAQSAKAMGSVDATVDLMLSLLPDNMLLPGLFLATCFISLSIGTSVGTIVALVPIAAGLAQSTGSPAALLTAVVVGGAFFGDNLSFISDTTIAATSSQGCSMSDKFKVNFFITTPAAIIILGVYTFMGMHMNTTSTPHPVDIMRVIPYIAVLATAIAGLNVRIGKCSRYPVQLPSYPPGYPGFVCRLPEPIPAIHAARCRISVCTTCRRGSGTACLWEKPCRLNRPGPGGESHFPPE